MRAASRGIWYRRHVNKQTGGALMDRLPFSTELRAQLRSAPAAVKVKLSPEASWVSSRRLSPYTASGMCMRTPITSAEPHVHGFNERVAPCTQKGDSSSSTV